MKGGIKKVTVQGHVKRPGEYDLHENLRLYDLLFLAGGFDDPIFRRDTYLERADIIRSDEKTQLNQIIPFNLENLLVNPADENIPLQGGDIIRIYRYDQIKTKEYVYIYGEVNSPGRYELKENMNLYDLITTSGSLKDVAFLDKIDVSRVSNIDGTLDRNIFPVDFSDDTARSFSLQSEDIITIRIDPEKRLRNFVRITGLVKHPGRYDFVHEKITSLITRAGGLTEEAFIEGARFYRKNQRLSIDLNNAFENPESDWNLSLISRDSLHIPIKDYSISVEGAVFFPKKIQYTKGKKSGYYIDLAGGFSRTADKKNVKLITPSGIILKARRFLFDPEVPYGSRIVVPAKQEPEQ